MNFHKFQTAFTFVELIIVIAIVAVLTAMVLLLVNPKKQMEKAWDAQRKHDLTMMQKTFEDYYNDKDGYPDPDELCVDAVVSNGAVCSCHICGLVSNNFSQYLPKLHCDPEYPRHRYLFQFSCTGDRQWYRLCSHLDSGESDLAYNYGVGSPNSNPSLCDEVVETEAPIPTNTPTPIIPPAATATPTSVPTSTPPVGPTATPTPTTAPTPTLDPSITQYYCSTTGCQPCNFTTEDCNSRVDLCEGELKLFLTYDACYTSRFDPINGCRCL